MARRNEQSDIFKHIDMRSKDECWPWLGTWGGRERDRRPYFMVDGKRTMAYRIVYELVVEPIPDGMMILHSCDHGGYPIGCTNPAHLSLGQHQQNMDEMRQRQRHGLPATVVAAIRRMLERGDTQESIAHVYAISRETVSAIATGRVYKPMRAAGANVTAPMTVPEDNMPAPTGDTTSGDDTC